MLKCKHCHKTVDSFMVGCFLPDGSDCEFEFAVEEVEDNIAQIDMPLYWCRYDLSEEEQVETLHYPHCGEYPFNVSSGVNIQNIVRVVCFND